MISSMSKTTVNPNFMLTSMWQTLDFRELLCTKATQQIVLSQISSRDVQSMISWLKNLKPFFSSKQTECSSASMRMRALVKKRKDKERTKRKMGTFRKKMIIRKRTQTMHDRMKSMKMISRAKNLLFSKCLITLTTKSMRKTRILLTTSSKISEHLNCQILRCTNLRKLSQARCNPT